MKAATGSTGSTGTSGLKTGPTTDGVPWGKVAVGLFVMVIVGGILGYGGALAISDDRDARFTEYRTRCADLPDDVVAAVSAGLVDLGGRTVRGVGTSQSREGDLSGSWFVSLELASPDMAVGSAGDIATFVVPDAGGAPAATDIRAVGGDALRFATWPDSGAFVDEDGGIASRWCAKDNGPAVLFN